jgi:hypothetical protein
MASHRRRPLRLAAVVMCLEVDLRLEGAAATGRGRRRVGHGWRRRNGGARAASRHGAAALSAQLPWRCASRRNSTSREAAATRRGHGRAGAAAAAVAEQGRRSTGAWAAVFGDPRYFKDVGPPEEEKTDGVCGSVLRSRRLVQVKKVISYPGYSVLL